MGKRVAEDPERAKQQGSGDRRFPVSFRIAL